MFHSLTAFAIFYAGITLFPFALAAWMKLLDVAESLLDRRRSRPSPAVQPSRARVVRLPDVAAETSN